MALLILVAAGCASTDNRAYVGASMASPGYGDPFYDELSPYGRWVSLGLYGTCWVPNDVPLDWRPYTNGYWGYTDYGWTWASNEPWGWATYHYGRWFYDPVYGWAWEPDTIWGPAWVAWRYGDDWAGWAPLPPSASWSASAGLSGGSGIVERIPSTQWSFVPTAQLLQRDLDRRIQPVSRNGGLLDRTANVTSFGVRSGKAVNRSLDLAVVERASQSHPPQVTIARTLTPPRPVPQDARRWQGAEQKRLDAFLRNERLRLARAQDEEYQAARNREERDALRRRHQAEDQAFEQLAAQQREALKRGERPAYQPFDRAAVPQPEAPGAQGQERGNGRGERGGHRDTGG